MLLIYVNKQTPSLIVNLNGRSGRRGESGDDMGMQWAVIVSGCCKRVVNHDKAGKGELFSSLRFHAQPAANRLVVAIAASVGVINSDMIEGSDTSCPPTSIRGI